MRITKYLKGIREAKKHSRMLCEALKQAYRLENRTAWIGNVAYIDDNKATEYEMYLTLKEKQL